MDIGILDLDNYQKIIFELITIQKWDGVEELLNKKIDPDIRDSAGNYLIHLLIYNNQIRLLELLLKLNPRLDIIDLDGKQICYAPIRYNQQAILKLLLDYNTTSYGIDITNFRDDDYKTALFYAIKFNSPNSAKLILEYGGRLTTTDKYKNTPLHEACIQSKEELVKSKLKHLLKVNDGIKIGGRNVNIKKISLEDKTFFLKQNHIQGTDKSNIFYGAYHKNELVGVMTFNSRRNMTKNNCGEFELSRYATKQNYLIRGLASKFIKHFINEYHPSSIISFADRRWTINPENNLYTNFKIFI